MPYARIRRFVAVIATVALCCALSRPAAAQHGNGPEDSAVSAMLLFCVTPIAGQINPADIASDYDLKELPPERAAMFTKGTPGRVFAVPGQVGNAVLIAYETGVCSVLVRKLDYEKFWASVDSWLGKRTKFKQISQKKLESGALEKSYDTNMAGRIGMIVSASPTFSETGVQGMMTASRVKTKQQ